MTWLFWCGESQCLTAQWLLCILNAYKNNDLLVGHALQTI